MYLLLRPEMTVMDFGAGRGMVDEDPVPYRRGLRTLKGKVCKVVGADVDEAVRTNTLVYEAVVIAPDAPLPFDDGTFDLIVSDWTLEHIRNASLVTGELARVLKPGGWICARTPNRWGYVALGARLVPERLQAAVLNKVQPERRECDVFPKEYRINSKGQLLRYFDKDGFDCYVYGVNSEPAYMGRSALLWRLSLWAFQLTPGRLSAFLHVFIQKKATG